MSSTIIESSIYYHLYSLRRGTPQEIFSAINCELISKVDLARGLASILNDQIRENPASPPVIRAIAMELAQAGEALRSIFREFAFRELSDSTWSLSPGEQIASFRNQALPHAIALCNVAASVHASASTLELCLPDAGFWIKALESAAQRIWAVIDVLTNPDLQLPPYLMRWLEIREVVHNQVRSGDRRALAPLLEALQNPEPDIRREAAFLLRHLQDPCSVAPLIALLDDEDASVRGEAAETLGTIGDQRAVEPLIACLIRYEDSRWGPAQALGDLRPHCALQPLVMALDEELAKEQPIPRILASLVRALESIGGPDAEQALMRYHEAKKHRDFMGFV